MKNGDLQKFAFAFSDVNGDALSPGVTRFGAKRTVAVLDSCKVWVWLSFVCEVDTHKRSFLKSPKMDLSTFCTQLFIFVF